LHSDSGHIRGDVITEMNDLECDVAQELPHVAVEEGERIGSKLLRWKEAEEPPSEIFRISEHGMGKHTHAPIPAVPFCFYKDSADAVT